MKKFYSKGRFPMSKEERKSSAPIIAVGTALVLTVALFTGIAAYKVVSHINADADEAYAAAISEANMRRLAESQTQAAANLNRIETIPVEVTVKINVVDERQNSSGPIDISVPDGYTVGDMININGEWYIIAKPSDGTEAPDGDSESGNQPGNGEGQGAVDNQSPDEITVNGETYVKKTDEDGQTDNPDGKDGDNGNSDGQNSDGNTDNTPDGDSQIPYIGAEYVTIDIDGNMVYLVQKGDTLTKVSRLTGYSVQEIAEYNHIQNVNLIYTGQSLRIPASPEAIEYVKSLQNSGK